jgi:hypothetical protein
MSFLAFLYYFLANLLGFKVIPHNIVCNGGKYFSIYDKDLNGVYNIGYSAYIISNYDLTNLFVVSHKSEYAVYLKTILELWKRRKQISF